MLSGTAWLCSCAFPQSLTPVSPHSLGTAACAVLLATVLESVTYLAVTQCCGWLRKRIVPNVLHPCPLRPFPRHFSTGRTGSQLTPHPFPSSPGPPPTKTAPHSRPTPILSHFQHSMPATAAWIHTDPAPTRSSRHRQKLSPRFFFFFFFPSQISPGLGTGGGGRALRTPTKSCRNPLRQPRLGCVGQPSPAQPSPFDWNPFQLPPLHHLLGPAIRSSRPPISSSFSIQFSFGEPLLQPPSKDGR